MAGFPGSWAEGVATLGLTKGCPGSSAGEQAAPAPGGRRLNPVGSKITDGNRGQIYYHKHSKQ